jgi:electron transfer flavoprotein beta subunit
LFTQAKKKPIETIEASTLGVDLTPRNKVIKVEEPGSRKAGSFVESVDQLVDKLKNEAKVI